MHWLYPATALVVLAFGAWFVQRYFGEGRREKLPVAAYAADMMEATKWLRPRLDEHVDAVFITGQAAHPDIISLVGLRYDPHQWFRDTRQVVQGPLPNGDYNGEEIYFRYGKIYFMFDQSSMTTMQNVLTDSHTNRVIFVVRPGELGLQQRLTPVHTVPDRDGRPSIWIFDVKVRK